MRVVWALLTFITYQAAATVLWVIGLVAVPVAILFRQQQLSPITGLPIVNAPRWLWLWGNDEDGLDPLWYQQANPNWGPWRRMFAWTAWRNSVNNLRFVPGLTVKPRADLIEFVTWSSGWFCWQGLYCCLQQRIGSHEITCGWRVYPADRAGVDPGDWRCWGAGFRISLLRVQP